MPKVKSIGRVYIGIDPGQLGGIAAIYPNGDVYLEAMPATDRDLWEALRLFSPTNVKCQAVLENVHSMPGQGVASMFKFGMGFGSLRMALTAAEIPFELVSPQKWQKVLGIPPRKKTEKRSVFKNRLLAHVQRLYPQVQGLTLKTADALLIAHYCKKYGS